MNLKDFLENSIFKIISEVGEEMKLDCYVIGGYVRDLILKRIKSKDIDIVVIGNGIEFSKKVNEKIGGKQEIKIFKNFGTSALRFENKEIEFVGARKESYTRNSRNPIVENGTLQDDQNRRDFTINTLAISLNKNNFGEFLDPFEGLKDIDEKIIKTPLNPDITYSDDPLRMFRGIRFASQLSFKIEEKSFNSIKKNINRINIISKERIVDELNKILLSPVPSIGFMLLNDSGILNKILPELTNLKGVEKMNNISHKDNFLHSLEVLDNLRLRTDNIWLLWAGLLHDIGKYPTKKFEKGIGWTFHGHEFIGGKMVYRLFKRLKLPLNEKMKYVQNLIKMSSRPIPLAENNASDSAVRRLIFEMGDDLEDLLLLCESDITTKNKEKKQHFLENYKIIRNKIAIIEEKDKIRNFKVPISGKEIINYFNKYLLGKKYNIFQRNLFLI